MPLFDLERLIGRRNGIIQECHPIEVPSSEPRLHAFAGLRGCLPWEQPEQQETRMGSSCGVSKLQAILACCGEIIERYCSAFVDNIIDGSSEDLRQQQLTHIDIRQFQFFSEEQYAQPQFPFVCPDVETKLFWTKVQNLVTRTDCYIPAESVYLSPLAVKQSMLFPTTSTGLACGANYEHAMVGAIFELIERDAFTNFWLNQLSPPRLDIPHTSDYSSLHQTFRTEQIDYLVLDITSDFNVPVIAVFSFGLSSYGYLATMGLGCHFSLKTALYKAFSENALSRLAIIHQRQQNSQKSYRPDFLDVMSFHDHLFLYSSDIQYRKLLEFLQKGHSRVVAEPSHTTSCAQDLVNIFRQKCYDLYIREVTTTDIASIGWSVVRAVCPQLTLLHGMHPYPFLGCQRLYHPEQVFSWATPRDRQQKFLFPPHMMG